MSEEEFTDEDLETLDQLGLGYPKQSEKQNIFAFFKRVITMADTTRTSNLTEDEMGAVKVPVRTNLELAQYCKAMGLTGLGNYFLAESQIISNSSLSREGFLDKLAVTQKRELETKSKSSLAKRRGWFKKKKEEGYS